MDILEHALKDLQKQIQKARIRGYGFTINKKSSSNADKVKDDKENELSQVKSTLNASSKSLSSSIKGAFGKKITTTLDNRKKLLDSL